MSDVGNVHSGEVESELEGVLRTLIAAAGRMGENIARAREDAARRAEAESTQRARELQVHYEQERVMARAQVQPVKESAWWDRARPEDIGHAYETTVAWKDADPNLAEAHAKMGNELRVRYGLDVDNIGADHKRVAEVVSERQAAADLIPVRGFPDWEQREADQLLNAADRHDRSAQAARDAAQAPEVPLSLAPTEAGPEGADPAAGVTAEESAADEDRNAGLTTWDSAERRDTHAEQMAGQGVDPVAIQAQYGADASNAKHPRAALISTKGAAKARKTANRAIATQRERGDRSR